ncbi:MAG: diguanylate cyclase [Candidatus Gastranaerophilaceae bacterium]
MGIFDKLKEFTQQVSAVENHLYSGKKDFLEIYERNAQLEQEIEERTNELNEANRRMLTLQHIWEMMNSSKPLSSILDTTVNNLQGELGYLHSCILQRRNDENGEYYAVMASSNDNFIDNINQVLKTPLNTQRLNFEHDNIIKAVLRSKEILQSTDLREGLISLAPNLSEEQVEDLLSETHCRSFMLVPLSKINQFGVLLVLSSRICATDAEIDFLKLFAQQIELAITIADLFQMVREQAVTDALTTLYNRRYFEEAINKEFTRANRQKQPFSVIGIDLDHLKQINDKYGHVYGDLAIKQISSVLKQNARSIDVPARIGGEEFNVLLPGIDSKGAMIAAERIRKAIEATPIETVGIITASLGVATFLEHANNVEELLELTDQAMYHSKRNGRNQVTLATPISEISWQEVALNAFNDILSTDRVNVSETMKHDLIKKLQLAIEQISNPKDTLYSVADTLASTYNPQHTLGSSKSKVVMATTLARRFELEKDDADKLRVAMLLYDIGNLMLPQEILQKDGPLTPEERAYIENHPKIAAHEILEPIKNVKDIIPIIEKHHENWDGSGYPNKLAGNDIPLSSQIILIIDAYFALTEPRIYRKAMSPYEALDVIKADANKKWNSTLVNEFVKLIEVELRKAD